MSYKIGEVLKITDGFEIKSALGKKTIQVKKDDKGFIDSNGFIHYITGNARGMLHRIDGLEIKGYDYESIANLIFKRLAAEFDIDVILDDCDINQKDLKEQIEDVLTDIM